MDKEDGNELFHCHLLRGLDSSVSHHVGSLGLAAGRMGFEPMDRGLARSDDYKSSAFGHSATSPQSFSNKNNSLQTILPVSERVCQALGTGYLAGSILPPSIALEAWS